MPHRFYPGQQGGRFYSTSISSGGLATLAVSSGSLYAEPIFVPAAITLSLIGIEVTSFAAGNVRLGIYYDNAGAPGALLQDSGAVGTGTPNAFKSVATSQVIPVGMWWLACVFDATPTVRALTTANSLHVLGAISGTDTAIHTGVSVAQAYGALPDPFTGGSALHTGNFPRVMISS